MVIAHIMGGLGNQLFQYACARSLAIKNKTELKLDITACEIEKNTHHNYYRLQDFNIQEENFATQEEIKNLPIVNEGDPFPSGDFLLHGYYQDEKYFSEIADTLREEFTLKKPLGKNSSAWREKILAAKCAVSLHVRCGDFFIPNLRDRFGVIPAEYYSRCVEELKKISPEFTLFVFSDDLKYTKNFLKLDVPVNFVEGCEMDCEELYLISLCKHNILSHSTFSWWSTWLNKNPDKKVFAPDPWTKEKVATQILESWIKIPVDYEKSAKIFPPQLSVIVYAENKNFAKNFTLPSIFSQNVDDFEVIFMTGRNKFEKLNQALDMAQGEYILFLGDGDFILNNTVQLLGDVIYNYLKLFLEAGNNYVSGLTGDYPDIISATMRLFENPNAEQDVLNGIVAGKKFNIAVDEKFQNLNGFINTKLSAAQKLAMLGESQTNNFLGTKFFKRDFLNRNKIRFVEDSSDAEIIFLTNAFLLSENITFIPSVFYGKIG